MNKLYYWRSRENFGDKLSPILLRHFTQHDYEWSGINESDIVSTGSVLDTLKRGYQGVIAGSGKLHEETNGFFPYAKMFGVRGPLTAKGIQGNIALGDPGLLASDLIELPYKEHNLGLLPHWSDTELFERPEFKKYNPLFIDPSDDPLVVIRQIASCRKLVTSSLHGVIVADAFNIPRRTELAKRFDKEGGVFKFKDYNASVGVPFEIGLTQVAPSHNVVDRQEEIYDMMSAVGDYLNA